MPQRPKQHVIDELAQRAFTSALPPAWIVNVFHKDYAKDYFIEVVEGEGVTGQVFVVQLKGKQNPTIRARDNTFSVPIDRDHLRYYMKVVPLPVFIVAINVRTGVGYFDFAQGQIERTQKLKEALEGDGTATLRIPLCNKLEDTSLLLRELSSAWDFMREKYPGSVEAAAKYRQQSLTDLDPRFKYEISIVDGKEHIRLSAKDDPVHFTVRIRGPQSARSRMQRFLYEGEPLVCDESVSIEMQGSPIFEKEPIKSISCTSEVPIEARVFAENEAGGRCFLPEFRGPLLGGPSLGRFKGRLPSCPIQIDLALRPKNPNSGSAKLDLRWDPNIWTGQDIASLPWLDPVHDFLEAFISKGARLGIVISKLGSNVLETFASLNAGMKELKHFREYVRILIKAKHVARTLQLNVVVPKDWSEQDVEDVEELYSLTTTGRYTHAGVHDFSCKMDRVPPNAAQGLREDENGTLRLQPSDWSFEFLGTTFDFSECCHEMANWEEAECRDVEEDGMELSKVRLRRCTRTTVWPRFLPKVQGSHLRSASSPPPYRGVGNEPHPGRG